MKPLVLIAAVLSAALLAGCATGSKWSGERAGLSGSLTGTVSYRERAALPAGAKIVVTLEDVTSEENSGLFVAQQTLRPQTQVPIAFDLRYIPSAIDLRHRYALRAAILDVQDQMLWNVPAPIAVSFDRPQKPIAITLERVPNPTASDTTPPPNTVVGFKCTNFAFLAKFFPGKVEIALAGRTLSLPQVLSGSGARYSDGATTFWNKGDGALFEMNGTSYNDCKVDPVESSPP